MTDEAANAEPRAVDPLADRLDRPLTELTVDELMAFKDEFAKRGVKFYNRASLEQMMLAYLLGNFSTAFIQALGQRAADGAAKLPKRMSDLVRTRVRRKGKPDESQIGVDDGSARAPKRTPPQRRQDSSLTRPTRLTLRPEWDHPCASSIRPAAHVSRRRPVLGQPPPDRGRPGGTTRPARSTCRARDSSASTSTDNLPRRGKFASNCGLPRSGTTRCSSHTVDHELHGCVTQITMQFLS